MITLCFVEAPCGVNYWDKVVVNKNLKGNKGMNNRIKWSKVVILIITIIFGIFLCISLNNRKSGKWTTHMDHLEWGMEEKEVQKFYIFADNGEEVSPHIFHYDLEELQEIYGCQMNITLIFEEGYGLKGVLGYTDEVEGLQKNIQDDLGKYRTGAQPSDGISWKSELVGDQYDKDQIEKGYRRILGENELTQNVLTGLLNSPSVSMELKTSGNRKGMLFIDADHYVKVQKLLTE